MKNLLPKFVKTAIYNRVAPAVIKDGVRLRSAIEQAIPKLELQEQHIGNLKVLTTREQLLARMLKGGVCAEIGVNRGDFSKTILDVTKPSKLHLIDMWSDPGRYHGGLRGEVERKFASEIASGIVQVNVGMSTEVLPKMPDAYFDWVYLDTDHTYSTTAAELSILKSKMKRGGVIAGHDYVTGNFISAFRYGVIEAVHELCVKDNWELVYLTIETAESRSFAIRKIE
jgi:hypothetical protein